MPVLLKRFKNLLIPSLHLGITYQGWKIISMKLGLADKYLNFFPCSHWLLSRAVWSVEEDAAILPVIWYLQARNLGLWWFVLLFFSLKSCWICSFRDLTRKREGKNPLGFGRRAAEWGASESCRKEGIQGPRSTAPREWLPSWGKEQPAWLKWRNWAKLGTFSPSKGDVWPKVSRACCFSLRSGAFEPLRTNLGEFQQSVQEHRVPFSSTEILSHRLHGEICLPVKWSWCADFWRNQGGDDDLRWILFSFDADSPF